MLKIKRSRSTIFPMEVPEPSNVQLQQKHIPMRWQLSPTKIFKISSLQKDRVLYVLVLLGMEMKPKWSGWASTEKLDFSKWQILANIYIWYTKHFDQRLLWEGVFSKEWLTGSQNCLICWGWHSFSVCQKYVPMMKSGKQPDLLHWAGGKLSQNWAGWGSCLWANFVLL